MRERRSPLLFLLGRNAGLPLRLAGPFALYVFHARNCPLPGLSLVRLPLSHLPPPSRPPFVDSRRLQVQAPGGTSSTACPYRARFFATVRPLARRPSVVRHTRPREVRSDLLPSVPFRPGARCIARRFDPSSRSRSSHGELPLRRRRCRSTVSR